MDKSDWSLLSEFTFSTVGTHHSVIGLYHSKCESNIVIQTRCTTSIAYLVKELIKHKKEDCKHLQGLKSKITIYDEVDNG